LRSAIHVEGLTFRYAGRKRPALREVCFDVPEGQTMLVLGPSGCGKSTLALCLNGMIPHVIAGALSGTVRVQNLTVGSRPLADTVRQVGIVFQDPEAQLCMLRVDEEIAFGLENLALPAADMPRRIHEALDLTGLDCASSMRTDWLSGGNKQRLALASVLAMGPSVLIFDEPTSNLDPAGARAVFETIARLRSEGRHTIVVVEHRLDQLMHLIDRVLVFGSDGTVLDDGEPHQVLRRQSRTLDAQGIWKPQVSEVAEALERRGVSVASYPITVAEAVAALSTVAAAPPADTPQAALPTPTDSAVSIRHLSAAYGRGPLVLHDVDLEVPRGEMLALVGSNGAGKSTLAHHVVATMRAPKGTVFLDGRDIRDIAQRDLAELVGYVFQNPEHQFVARTVFDELAFGLRLRDLPEDVVRARVEAMLADFGLVGLAAANPFKLSHGEKRRLSVATMLILGQRVLVLDEPTFGQDRRHAAALLEKFGALRERGTTVILVTHDMRLVAEHAQHVAVLHGGRVLAHATPDAIFDDEHLLAAAHLEVPPVRAVAEQLFGERGGLRLPATVTELVGHLTPSRAEAGVGI
jgi:energy-coupling factor transport system ATP-binding protein